MTKIEIYKIEKNKADQMGAFISELRNERCDKKGCKVTITDDYTGYYGSSSTGSWGTSVREQMAIQMEKEIFFIATKALERLEKVAEQKRVEARDEALQIIKDIENDN